MILKVANPEKFRGYIAFELLGGLRFYSNKIAFISLRDDGIVAVELADNATTFIRNLERNFDFEILPA